MNLLTYNNSKTIKGEKKGYLTAVMYLKPADSGGFANLCPKASEGCKAACLNTAGRGIFNNVQQARQNRTALFFQNHKEFKGQLHKEIEALKVKAKKKDLIPCVRINGTSDMPQLAREIAVSHPDLIFYDYTKIPNPHTRVLDNYHITFSRSESNEDACKEAIDNGVNVAVVFENLPETYWGRKVIAGDETDLRFLDETGDDGDGKGIIVGLTAKGKAKKDESGFVVRNV